MHEKLLFRPLRASKVAGAVLALSLAVAPVLGASAGHAAGSADAAAFRFPTVLGFHDVDRSGNTRAVRNDLTGALKGQVEFAQSSTIDPSGNAAREMPTLVAQRTTLLMFTPAQAISGVSVEVREHGKLLGVLTLDEPDLLPETDQLPQDDRDPVVYSLRAWSVELPWNWVTPAMSLEFTDTTGAKGSLAAEAIDVAAPTELVINNIRLGMLTAPPVSSGQRFINDPANGGTDYFQTIPVSKLTIAQYEDVELEKVIVASGEIYTTSNPSKTHGDAYSGDLRENVGKAQFSTGVNLANFGTTSSTMTQQQPGIFNQRVIHHSAGKYANGVHSHGLSGGNGMATLYDSVGNELSHELGHSYGLGHYPGADHSQTGDDIMLNASHHLDSGWGYIAHRTMMRSNLSLGGFNPDHSVDGVPFGQNLAGQYNFNTDAMSGGEDHSPISDYTHHTGYSAKRIQNSLQTLVPDANYPSGYRDWDEDTGRFVDAADKDPEFAQPAPIEVGVPVFTLLGGYNPSAPQQTVLYPAFRSNYGNTFDNPQADPGSQSPSRECWVEVSYLDGKSEAIKLDASDGVKQLNVNIAESSKPTSAQVNCRQDGTTTPLGDPIGIETDLEPMPTAVVIGQEAGFEALRTQELRKLQPKLEELAAATTPVLNAADAVVLNGWKDDLSALSPAARAVADKIITRSMVGKEIDAFIKQNADELAAGTPDRKMQLARKLVAAGMLTSEHPMLPTGSSVTVDNGKCLQLEDAASAPVASATEGADLCSGGENEKWIVDASGAIHPLVRPDLCMNSATPVGMVPCSPRSADQQWIFDGTGQVVRSDNVNSALDLNRHTLRPAPYSRHGGANQTWETFEVSTSAVLVAVSPASLSALFALDLDSLDVAAIEAALADEAEPDPDPSAEPTPDSNPSQGADPTTPTNENDEAGGSADSTTGAAGTDANASTGDDGGLLAATGASPVILVGLAALVLLGVGAVGLWEARSRLNRL